MKEREGGADNHQGEPVQHKRPQKLQGYRVLAAGLSLFTVGGLTGQSSEGCGSEIQALTQSVAAAIDSTKEAEVPTGYDASYASEALVEGNDINLIYTGLDYSDGSFRMLELHGEVVDDQIAWDTSSTEIPTGLTNPLNYIKIGSDEYVVAEKRTAYPVLFKNGIEFLDLGSILGISRTGNDNELYVSLISGHVHLLDLTKGTEDPDRTERITVSGTEYDYYRPVIWSQGEDMRLMTRYRDWEADRRICSFDTRGGLTWTQEECPTELNGMFGGVVSTDGKWFFASENEDTGGEFLDRIIKVSPINPEPPTDVDGDGYSPPDDCDDTDRDVHPGATEICDGIDNDCEGGIDEGVTKTYCFDGDRDGFGDEHRSSQACSAPSGYVADCNDCDDTQSSVNPSKAEITCDGLDNDCKTSTVDEPNLDGDPVTACDGDCIDTDSRIYPGATEICEDGLDNDCSSGGNPSGDAVCPENCTDLDGDRYGTGPDCLGADCDDGDASVYPGAPELCDGQWNDCTLAALPPDESDFDKDGSMTCEGDCDDTNPDIGPGEREIDGDTIDQNCDGVYGGMETGNGDISHVGADPETTGDKGAWFTEPIGDAIVEFDPGQQIAIPELVVSGVEGMQVPDDDAILTSPAESQRCLAQLQWDTRGAVVRNLSGECLLDVTKSTDQCD